MGGVRGKVFANTFQRRHPWYCQVTILQSDPTSILCSIGNHFCCYRTLKWQKYQWKTFNNRHQKWNDKQSECTFCTCPCPSEMALNLSPVKPLSAANFSKSKINKVFSIYKIFQVENRLSNIGCSYSALSWYRDVIDSIQFGYFFILVTKHLHPISQKRTIFLECRIKLMVSH